MNKSMILICVFFNPFFGESKDIGATPAKIAKKILEYNP